jgi:hypothetical protein
MKRIRIKPFQRHLFLKSSNIALGSPVLKSMPATFSIRLVAVLMALAVMFPLSVKAGREIRVLEPVADAFIASDLADINTGATGTLSLGRFNGKDNTRIHRLIVAFDPAAAGIPPGERPERVLLRLSWTVFNNWDPDAVVRVHRVLRPWGEGTGNFKPAQPGEVTWASARHGAEPWQVAGCAGAEDRSGKFVEQRGMPHVLDFDVAPLYAEWLAAGGTGRLGFIVIADGAGQRSTVADGQYVGQVESNESESAPGVTLLVVKGAPAGGAPAPLWSHLCPGKDKVPQPAQFGLIDGGIFHGASYNGHVYSIELATGKRLADWSVSPSGCYSAPALMGGKLHVFARDKKLYRLEHEPETRAVVVADYSREPGTTRVESLAHDAKSGLFFLGTGSSVHAVDATGREHWSVPHANEQWGEPMWCDGALYTYDTKTRQVVKYLTVGTAAPTRAWSCDIGSVTAELARGLDGDGDALVFVSGWKFGKPGTLTAVHDTGPSAGKPKWGPIKLSHPLKHCSVREGHDELLLPAHNGFVEIRRASTGDPLRRIPIVDAAGGSTPWSQVVISEPYAIVATHDVSARDNYLYVFDIPSGRELWRSAAFPGSVACMIPVVSDGIGVVGTYDEGTWHAFRLGEGNPFPFSRFAGPRHNGQAAGALKTVQGH